MDRLRCTSNIAVIPDWTPKSDPNSGSVCRHIHTYIPHMKVVFGYVPSRYRQFEEPQSGADCRVEPKAPGRFSVDDTNPASPHMDGCQNYGPLLGPLNIRRCSILGTRKGTTILTTTHVYKTTILLRIGNILVHKVMQDVYHQQYEPTGRLPRRNSALRARTEPKCHKYYNIS